MHFYRFLLFVKNLSMAHWVLSWTAHRSHSSLPFLGPQLCSCKLSQRWQSVPSKTAWGKGFCCITCKCGLFALCVWTWFFLLRVGDQWVWWWSGKPSAREAFKLVCSSFICIRFIPNSHKPGLYYQSTILARLYKTRRRADVIYKYTWDWYCLFDSFKESLCLNMDEETQLYIRKSITYSEPPWVAELVYYSKCRVLHSNAPDTCLDLAFYLCVCHTWQPRVWDHLVPACTAATTLVRGLWHVCWHGQAMEPTGNPSHMASVSLLIQWLQCCPE